jgi:hypothetical protein
MAPLRTSLVAHFASCGLFPFVFCRRVCSYEISPIMVQFTEVRKSLLHFLTQLCAILGGVFVVFGLVDRMVYSSFRHMRLKHGQGKLI